MNTHFLKNSNKFFGWFYTLLFFFAIGLYGLSFAGVQIDISDMSQSLINIKYNNSTEWIMTILVILTILFSSFIHFRLAKAVAIAKITYFLVWTTIINLLVGSIGLYFFLVCRGESCLVVLFPTAIVVLLFILTLITGVVSFVKSK